MIPNRYYWRPFTHFLPHPRQARDSWF